MGTIVGLLFHLMVWAATVVVSLVALGHLVHAYWRLFIDANSAAGKALSDEKTSWAYSLSTLKAGKPGMPWEAWVVGLIVAYSDGVVCLLVALIVEFVVRHMAAEYKRPHKPVVILPASEVTQPAVDPSNNDQN